MLQGTTKTAVILLVFFTSSSAKHFTVTRVPLLFFIPFLKPFSGVSHRLPKAAGTEQMLGCPSARANVLLLVKPVATTAALVLLSTETHTSSEVYRRESACGLHL